MMSSKETDIEKKLAAAVSQETPDMLDDLITEINAIDQSAPDNSKSESEPEQAASFEQERNNTIEASQAGADAMEQTTLQAGANAMKPVAVQAGAGAVKLVTVQAGASAVEQTTLQAGASEKKKWRLPAWTKAVAAIAAVFVLFTGVRTLMNSPKQTFAVIGLDVNPGVEMTIDQDERVLSAYSVNDDGEAILADMDLAGSDVNVACNAIIGAMLTKGYLTAESNSILVSVRAVEEARGKEIERDLSEKMNGFLENSEIAAAILGQYVKDDSELEKFAEENGISIGKAWLIKNLLATGSKNMTEESLLKLTTQELILLGQERNVEKENSYGKSNTSKYIGALRAKSIALKAAGITKSQASGVKAEFDCDDGVIVYEVEFVANGFEYEYDIDAVSGKIISSDNEKSDRAYANSGSESGNSAYDDDDDDWDDRDDRDDRDDDDWDDRDDDDDDRDDDDD